VQIHFSPRDVRLTGAIHGDVAERIMRLEDTTTEILPAHVVLLHDEQTDSGGIFSVKVHLAIRGPDIHASDVDDDLYSAIDKISDKLARQLRKRNTRLVDKRRKSTWKNADQKSLWSNEKPSKPGQ